MRELHVVALSEDGRSVLLAATRGATRGGFRVTLDDRLAAAVRGDLPRAGETAARDSTLTPKEIQSRLRAGESPAEIAREAGVAVARVERFSGPVLSERARVIDAARSSYLVRGRLGRSARPLGEVVTAALESSSGYRSESEDWTTRRQEDGRWSVTVTWYARARTRTASWTWDPASKELTATDGPAAALGHCGPAPAPASAKAAPAPVVKRTVTPASPVAKGTGRTASPVAKRTGRTASPVAKRTAAPASPVAKQAGTPPVAKRAVTRTSPAAKRTAVPASPVAKRTGTPASPGAKRSVKPAAPMAKGTAPASPAAKRTVTTSSPVAKRTGTATAATAAPRAQAAPRSARPARATTPARLRVVPDPPVRPVAPRPVLAPDGSPPPTPRPAKARAAVPGWADVLLGTDPRAAPEVER